MITHRCRCGQANAEHQDDFDTRAACGSSVRLDSGIDTRIDADHDFIQQVAARNGSDLAL